MSTTPFIDNKQNGLSSLLATYHSLIKRAPLIRENEIPLLITFWIEVLQFRLDKLLSIQFIFQKMFILCQNYFW